MGDAKTSPAGPGPAVAIRPGRRRGRGLAAGSALLALATTLAACAGSGGSAAGGGTLIVADLAPFTGPDALLGPGFLAGCYAATHVIDSGGGVLGHKLQCKSFDTRGDPADAVPATRQMFAGTANLALVIGPTSDEAAAVVPIIDGNSMVVFSGTGQSEFDQNPYKYFYRLTPPDIYTAYALVATAHFRYHYSRVALAFGNDIGSQTFVKPAEQAIKTLGMTLAANEALNLTATSYRTEVSTILASHPDVIFTEALGPADAIFLSEVKQLNHGKMIPVIGTSPTIDPTWYSAVAAAIGSSTLQTSFVADTLGIETSGPAYTTYKNAILASKSEIKNYQDYLTHPQSLHFYDAVTLAALAMVKSHSTTASVYRGDIKPIANGVPGATVVTSYARGVKLLKEGKNIRYVGPGGPTNFNQYNNSSVNYQVDKYGPGGSTRILGSLPAAEVAAAGGS
jgi:branched-chain amino acid transport system substrate-binding protein